MPAWRAFLGGMMVLGVASCAGPPLVLYTLNSGPEMAQQPPLGRSPVVIAIARVVIPEDLDNEDILIRSGSTLRRSSVGRWASRLSVEITDRMTTELAERRPDALVTNRPGSQTPSYRIMINFSRLDVNADGNATLEADWVMVPQDPAAPTRRDRAALSVSGPVATDEELVALERLAVDRFSRSIEVPGALPLNPARDSVPGPPTLRNTCIRRPDLGSGGGRGGKAHRLS